MLQNEAVKAGKELPPPIVRPAVVVKRTRCIEPFEGVCLKWTIAMRFVWFGAYFITCGLGTWLPSLYTTKFGPTVAEALNWSTIIASIGLPISFVIARYIDRSTAFLMFPVVVVIADIVAFLFTAKTRNRVLEEVLV
jgi:amino acid permease